MGTDGYGKFLSWGRKRENGETDEGRYSFRSFFLTHTFTYMSMFTHAHTQIAAAAALHCSVFMMRRTNISMGLGIVRGGGVEREGWEWKGERGSYKNKRRGYLKYYTYQGECSVEQAL